MADLHNIGPRVKQIWLRFGARLIILPVSGEFSAGARCRSGLGRLVVIKVKVVLERLCPRRYFTIETPLLVPLKYVGVRASS